MRESVRASLPVQGDLALVRARGQGVDGLRDPQKTDRRFVTSEPRASGREVHRVAQRL